jgi:methylated-DNA-[protein]-cysteine S-methyltransferase
MSSNARVISAPRPMNQLLQLLIDRIDTPIGQMMILADHDGNLRAADWADYEERMHRLLQLHYGRNGFRLEPTRNPHGLSDTIKSYFAGNLQSIDAVPVRTAGTQFQRDVWRALGQIACGTTISYSELARRIERPDAIRAVGLANGSNPIGIVVPCHRVIGANGSLTGYGGGIERKRWLLRHEGAMDASQRPHDAAFHNRVLHASTKPFADER